MQSEIFDTTLLQVMRICCCTPHKHSPCINLLPLNPMRIRVRCPFESHCYSSDIFYSYEIVGVVVEVDSLSRMYGWQRLYIKRAGTKIINYSQTCRHVLYT